MIYEEPCAETGALLLNKKKHSNGGEGGGSGLEGGGGLKSNARAMQVTMLTLSGLTCLGSLRFVVCANSL